MQETAAIQYLKEENLPFRTMEYPEDGPVAATEVAAYFGFGESADRLFKTLVTTDHKGHYYVFALPAPKRLDLKKAAALVGVKNLQMLKPDVFEALTGYTHGGCSPFGMKTQLPTVVDSSALAWDSIYLSGGKIGLLIDVAPALLADQLSARFEEITKAD